MARFRPRLFVCLLTYILIINGATADTLTEETTDFHESQPADSTELQDQTPEFRRPGFHLGPVITDWDEQRAKWLEENPRMKLNRRGQPRVVLATSSQTEPCPSLKGDYYLLKALKNKVDYTRLHDIELYYNMAVLQKTMTGFFVKYPLLRKLMVSHPEAEWIWWMDSDAFFTDMTFAVPFEKYEGKNLIVHGWEGEIYDHKSWVGLNAGIFIIRNCQWSLTMLDTWAGMGEDYDDHLEKLGTFASQALYGRPNFPMDDQAALVYMLSTSHTEELKPKVVIENSYALHGFWVWAMGRHDELLKESEPRKEGEEYWPFITHFVGCKSCSGAYASYDLDLCLAEMERAFNIADNQVLHLFGFEHKNLSSPEIQPTRRDWRRPLDFFRLGALDFLRQHPWGGAVSENKVSSLTQK